MNFFVTLRSNELQKYQENSNWDSNPILALAWSSIDELIGENFENFRRALIGSDANAPFSFIGHIEKNEIWWLKKKLKKWALERSR